LSGFAVEGIGLGMIQTPKPRHRTMAQGLVVKRLRRAKWQLVQSPMRVSTALKATPGNCSADHAGPGAVNRMKFYLVEAFLQLASPAVVDLMNCRLWPGRAPNNPARRESRDHQHRISWGGGYDREVAVMRRREGVPVHLFADDGALAAILVRAGVAAILTSISLTGFSVQAWVT